MKKTLKLGFGRRPHNFPNFFHNISSSLGRIKLHTENQPPSLFNSGDSYEEDLKISIWKMTLMKMKILLGQIFQVKANCIQKSESKGCFFATFSSKKQNGYYVELLAEDPKESPGKMGAELEIKSLKSDFLNHLKVFILDRLNQMTG